MRAASPTVWVAFAGALLCAPTSAGADSHESPDGDGDASAAPAQPTVSGQSSDSTAIREYFDRLEDLGLIDADTGSRDSLRVDVREAEKLLRSGAPLEAAVALYSIVESPRYRGLDDFTEYHNAEYYLGVSLATVGAYDAAIAYLSRSLSRGPSSLYFAPAHRRVINIALETKRYEQVLASLTAVKLNQPLPPGPVGERAYLRARIAYAAGKFGDAEGELSKISRKSRLYSSALYLRGVIRTRRGEFRAAANALCEIVDTPDTDKYTFVVDDRYFTIKDLARLGLGRIAHETAEYDDAYYHYFQIPDDSDRLPEALFEAAWSMYQRRELPTARDLVKEFIKTFPDSPLTPEAHLLSGYVDLADCEFDGAQQSYDKLIAELQPIVNTIEKMRKDKLARTRLFERALTQWQRERADPQKRLAVKLTTPEDRVLALLRVDPRFVRIHKSIAGLRTAAGEAPRAVNAWSSLARRVSKTDVKKIDEDAEPDISQGLIADISRLEQELSRAKAHLRRGMREKTIGEDDANAELARLDELGKEIAELAEQADRAAAADQDSAAEQAPPGLRPMIQRDLKEAAELSKASTKLLAELTDAADAIAAASIEKLYKETRRVLDKAKLGKIDAVIGQKRKLDIEVQDLAAGRYPPELHGKLWEKGLIGDDEEFWPFEGEFWADEYEGWR